jgi:hypothetical protein
MKLWCLIDSWEKVDKPDSEKKLQLRWLLLQRSLPASPSQPRFSKECCTFEAGAGQHLSSISQAFVFFSTQPLL